MIKKLRLRLRSLLVANPSYRRTWEKQGFLKQNFFDRGIRAQRLCRESKKATVGSVIFFKNLQANEISDSDPYFMQTLLLLRHV